LRLTVLGCAGSFPSAASPASSYLVEHAGHRIVLDLGNGALGALQRHVDLVWPGALDAVVLSHCHVDHCVDAASLYVQRHYAPERTTQPLTVLGPSDTRERLARIYGMHDPRTLESEFAFASLSDPHQIGPFTITTCRAAHPVEAYSIRVEAGGSSLVYSGDTGPNTALVDLARGADIALIEASFVGRNNPPDLHMSGADAGRIAREADVRHLVLTHLVVWNDPARVLAEAQAEFDGPITLAEPGRRFDVSTAATV